MSVFRNRWPCLLFPDRITSVPLGIALHQTAPPPANHSVTSLLTDSEVEEEVAVPKAPAPKAAGKGKVAAKSKAAPKVSKVGVAFATG